MVEVPTKIENPVEFLTNQVKLDLDAVKLRGKKRNFISYYGEF